MNLRCRVRCLRVLSIEGRAPFQFPVDDTSVCPRDCGLCQLRSLRPLQRKHVLAMTFPDKLIKVSGVDEDEVLEVSPFVCMLGLPLVAVMLPAESACFIVRGLSVSNLNSFEL